MASLRSLLVCSVYCIGVCLCLTTKQKAPNLTEDVDKPLVITNTTRTFVEKVFKQYTENSNTTQMTIQDFYHLLNALKIGQVFEVQGHVETLDKDSKSIANVFSARQKRSLSEQPENNMEKGNYHNQRFHNSCITKDRLLEMHDIKKDKPISSNDFIKLCPSLVYEVQSGDCWHAPDPIKLMKKSVDVSLKVWLYGISSIAVISLSSLLAIAIIPCLGKAIYNKLMSFLVALAVGTLSGDAFLHLIPHAFLKGIHTDDEEEEHHVNPLWKGVVIMSGIYLFFLIESFMKVRMARHERLHKQEEQDENIDEGISSPRTNIPLVETNDIVNHNNCSPRDCDEASRDKKGFTTPSADSNYMTDLSQSDAGLDSTYSDGITVIENKNIEWKESLYLKDELQGTDECCNDVPLDTKFDCAEHHCHSTSQLNPRYQSPISGTDSVSVGDPALGESDKTPVVIVDNHHDHDNHHHHHHHHHHQRDINKDTSIASVAWMVIVGDGFHNFSDGLAVGAAFSSSITTGLTTAIAVLCHELPHELGDFAILIKSGISFRQAVVYNLASALMSFVGVLIGIGVGNLDTSHVWVLALTAGLFLYISMVSMLPELKIYQEKGSYAIFFSQNIGILTGILIMLVIAMFEEH